MGNKNTSESSSKKINGIEIGKMKTAYLRKTIKQFTIITVLGLAGVVAIAMMGVSALLNDSNISTMSMMYLAFALVGGIALAYNIRNLKSMKTELKKRTDESEPQNEINLSEEIDTTVEEIVELDTEIRKISCESTSENSEEGVVTVLEEKTKKQDVVEKDGYNLTAREMQLMAINAGCLESTAANGSAGFDYIADSLRPDEKVVFCIATGPIYGEHHSLGNCAIVLTDARLIFAGGTSDFIKTVSSFSLDLSRIDAIDMQAAIMAYNLMITSAGEQIKCTFAAMKDQRGSDYLRYFINAIYDCKQAKSEAKQTTNIINQVSAADELKKFKELLDMGVISQEEFDAKKKELLGI